jgi:hypothetical protein
MSRRGEVIPYMKLSTPLSEWFAVELFTVVGDKRMWHTVATDDIFPQEPLNGFGRYVG